jgi:Fic family protein
LSYTSSKLEGNTYSYLDTEVLLKYNEAAEGKSQMETQMILNHKTAIKYLIDNRKNIQYTKQEFMNIHALLAKGLLVESYVGTIRSEPVTIGSSAYIPLDNKFQLEEAFTLFLKKLNAIKNPYEQALFTLIFISYFQLFMDGNKRTARITANIPLIKNGLAPASFLQVKDRDYIDAILAVYELNATDFIRDIFVQNYLLNVERYD